MKKVVSTFLVKVVIPFVGAYVLANMSGEGRYHFWNIDLFSFIYAITVVLSFFPEITSNWHHLINILAVVSLVPLSIILQIPTKTLIALLIVLLLLHRNSFVKGWSWFILKLK
ncbi:MAG: hypothetical protein U9Q34_02865 [Elusimicrobiota bacterium]|nr:hypothetical protein [Elusimicrobiota bacterium]